MSFWTLNRRGIQIAFFSHLKIFCHINFRQSRKIPLKYHVILFSKETFLWWSNVWVTFMCKKNPVYMYAFLSMRWLPQNNGMKLYLNKPSFPTMLKKCTYWTSNFFTYFVWILWATFCADLLPATPKDSTSLGLFHLS